MTQKDKLIKAEVFANRVRSIAHLIQREANEYDCKWPNTYVSNLLNIADEMTKVLGGK